MIQKLGPNQRRILRFPAVQPCESVSQTTLLNSLIILSHDITNHHSKFFPSQKKLIREIIRQIEILLIFFEEIRDNVTIFTNSLSICFIELHFCLQKIQFLVEDCTREGARLFILMNSEFIANQFQILIKSFAIALDVIELNSLQISSEVKELVELLSNQAQKTKLEPDPNDQGAIEGVNLIMNKFEHGLEPEKCLIKRIMGYLGIKSWIDCSNEVRFLEEEISNVEDEVKEIRLLSNLLWLMYYCRGVVFETMCRDEHVMNQFDAKLAKEMLKWLNPEDFRCPISLEMMKDPVIVSTGQTYDRRSIQKWLKAGNLLCPKTGERLKSSELIPNSALKKIIDQFCLESGILKSGRRNRDLLKTIASPSHASKEAMRFLAQFLGGRLRYGTDEQKNKAAYEIRLLTKSNMFNRMVLIEVGNVALLLDLLTSSNADIQENSIAALLKLSKDSKGQRAIFKEGGLMLLILVLRRGLKMESRQNAAAIIFYLSSVDKYRRLIGLTRETIPALIELIKDGTMCGKKNALAAIFGLLLYHGNHQRALEADIVGVLVELIASIERSDIIADSLAVLASLAENIDGSIAIIQASALPLITGLVKSSIAQTGKEYCVSILLSLCINAGAEAVAHLAKEPALVPSLYSVVVDGSSQVCKNVHTVVYILQKFHESSSPNLEASSAVQKERILHVF